MANRLKKLATASYSPGATYKPAVVGYCYQQPSPVAGRWEYGFDNNLVSVEVERDENGNRQWAMVPRSSGGNGYQLNPSVRWVPGSTTYTKVCIPSSPAVPGVPATTSFTAIMGWNGGASAAIPMVGDGYYGFFVSDVPAAVVVGLSPADRTLLPSEQQHAFHVRGTTVEIMEAGVVVATCPVPHTAASQYRIARSGTTVNYSYGGWTYTSAAASRGAQFLDASIYASGDYIDSPTLGVITSLGARADLGFTSALGLTTAGVGNLLGMRQVFGTVDRAYLGEAGDMRRMRAVLGFLGTASAVEDHTLSTTNAFGTLGKVRMAFTGAANDPVPDGYGVGGAHGVLPALGGAASDRAYSYAHGVLPMMDGSVHGGFPEVSLAYCYGVLPPLSGFAYLPTGEIGTASGTLPALMGRASQGIYGEVRGTLPALTGTADTGDVDPNTKTIRSTLLIGGRMGAEFTVSAGISGTLQLRGAVSGLLSREAGIQAALALAGNVSAYAAVSALIRSGLLLAGSTSAAPAVDEQYAVNVLTGALTTYSGFGFTSFATAGNTAYGTRSDGVYLIRSGDDNGSPITATLDFGSADYGAANSKTVESLYLGIATDGQIFAKLCADDGAEHAYRVIQHGANMRAVTAKGVKGRRWNLSLEVVDATFLELDSIEQFVAVSTRRWVR